MKLALRSTRSGVELNWENDFDILKQLEANYMIFFKRSKCLSTSSLK